MCDPVTAGVVIAGTAIAIHQKQKAERQAKRQAKEAGQRAADEEKRIRRAETEVENRFGPDSEVQRRADAKVEDFTERQLGVADTQFEQQQGRLDIANANRGLTGPAATRGRKRLLRGLALQRGKARASGVALGDSIQDRLANARRQLISQVRTGGAAPSGSEVVASQQSAVRQALENAPDAGVATGVNQANQAVQTDTQARAGGRRGLSSLDFLQR